MRVDDNEKVIWAVATYGESDALKTKRENFEGRRIIHPAVGIRMVKLPKTDPGRPQLPAPWSRLRRMWKIASDSCERLPSIHNCQLCGVTEMDSDIELVYTCALCQTAYHSSCRTRIAEMLLAVDLRDVVRERARVELASCVGVAVFAAVPWPRRILCSLCMIAEGYLVH